MNIVGAARLKRARSYSNKDLTVEVKKWRKTRKNQNNVMPRMVPSRVEKKWNDSRNSITTTTANCVPILLNGIPQGDDSTERLGKRINMTNVAIRATASIPANATQPFDSIRVIIFYDRQPNQLTPAVTDILTTASQDAHINLFNSDRFWVVLDHYLTVSVNGPDVCQMKENRKLNTTTVYGGVGATAASINSGALWLLCYPLAPASANQPTFKYDVRVKYADP